MFGKFLKNIVKDIKKEIGADKKHSHEHHNKKNENVIPKNEYYAVVSKSGLFYEGDIKDLSFDRGRVNMCSSYDELLKKLTNKLNEEFERCKQFNQPLPTKTSAEALKAKYPDKEIITICSTVEYNKK